MTKHLAQQKQKQEAQQRFLKIFAYAVKHPDLTQRQIGDHFGVSDFPVRRALLYGLWIESKKGK